MGKKKREWQKDEDEKKVKMKKRLMRGEII